LVLLGVFLGIGFIFSNWMYFEKFSFYGNFFRHILYF
jgi:hypothetical protein